MKSTSFLKPRRARLACVALAIASAHLPAAALDYTWGGGTGSWSDASGWTLAGLPPGFPVGAPSVADSATLNAGTLQVVDGRSVSSFTINGGQFGGAGGLNTGTFAFNGGRIGYSTSTGGGVLNVLGTSTFNGAAALTVDYSHELLLHANGTWTPGNGRIQVEGAYQQGNVTYPTAWFTIRDSATFTDQGAASVDGFKALGFRGAIENAGTYQRNGLGTTGIINLNNTGTVNVNSGALVLQGDGGGPLNTQSSGTVNVAAGSVLQFFGTGFADSSLITGGRIANSGLVRVSGTVVDIKAAAQINGAWQVDGSTAVLQIGGLKFIGPLTVDSGYIAGPGRLETTGLVFNSGRLGYSTATGGGSLVVSGDWSLGASATFNGAGVQTLDYSHSLYLTVPSTWTAGNGRIEVNGAYQQGSVVYPTSRLVISNITTFQDLGAATSSGVRALGGNGLTENYGRYVRTGLGTTVAAGFSNLGTLEIASGAMEVDASFRNQGVVNLAGGTLLRAYQDGFRNDGTVTGTGTLRTWFANRTLDNLGTLDPGSLAGTGASGTLTVDGNLGLTPSSTLRIDFDGSGVADRLAITGSVTLGGTLAAWAAPGQVFELGQSFVVLTAGQGPNMGSFTGLTWLGAGANPFSLVYAPQSVSLLVTTAVPEPATAALWALGLLAVVSAGRARELRQTSGAVAP